MIRTIRIAAAILAIAFIAIDLVPHGWMPEPLGSIDLGLIALVFCVVAVVSLFIEKRKG